MPRKSKSPKEQLVELTVQMEKLKAQEDRRKIPIGINIVDIIEAILGEEITPKDVATINNFLLEQEERGRDFSKFMAENSPKKKTKNVHNIPKQGNTLSPAATSEPQHQSAPVGAESTTLSPQGAQNQGINL